MSQPTNRPFKMSIMGIDGAGKDSVAEAAMGKASREYGRTMKLGRPTISYADGEPTERFPKTTKELGRLHRMATVSRSPCLTAMVCAAEVITQTRFIERAVTAQETTRPEIIASSRDPLVDSIAYINHFAPSAVARSISTKRQLHMLKRSTAAERDLLVYLKVEPELAMERILNRGRQLSAHENPSDLAMLANNFASAIQAHHTEYGTPVVEIDASELSIEQVTDLTLQALFSTINGNPLAEKRSVTNHA